MKMKNNKAFTLIELLVVISIIALLVSILMPSLNKARSSAKDVMCLTNLKTMQIASLMYTSDHSGKMPQYDYAAGLWINKLTKYMAEIDESRICHRTKARLERMENIKSYQYGTAKNSWVWYWDGMDIAEEGCYSINGWFYSEVTLDQSKRYNNYDQVKMTSVTPVFADSKWLDSQVEDTDSCPANFDLLGTDTTSAGGMSRYLLDRHDGKINVGFADGSQRPVELKNLWALKWHRTFKMKGEVTREDGSPIYQR